MGFYFSKSHVGDKNGSLSIQHRCDAQKSLHPGLQRLIRPIRHSVKMTKNWHPLKPIRSPFLSVNPEQAAEILNRHKTICAFIWVFLCGIQYAAYYMPWNTKILLSIWTPYLWLYLVSTLNDPQQQEYFSISPYEFPSELVRLGE